MITTLYDPHHLLQTLVIPQYPTKMQLSKSRRPKYYTEKDLPKKYQKLVHEGIYSFKSGRLVDENKKPVIKNKAFINKPRFLTFSGNHMISGYDTPHKRALIANFLHKFFKKYTCTLRPFNEKEYPIAIEWEIHTTLDPKVEWDASNLFFYYKYFEDSLVANHIIPDDNWKYIIKPGNAPFIIPIHNFDERKFVFRFYKVEGEHADIINQLRNSK